MEATFQPTSLICSVLGHVFILCLRYARSDASFWGQIAEEDRSLPSRGFSRQEHWSGVPLPSLVHVDSDHQNALALLCASDLMGLSHSKCSIKV